MLKVNHNHKIIHDTERIEERCNLDDAAESNIQVLQYQDMVNLVRDGYLFCRWCFPHEVTK